MLWKFMNEDLKFKNNILKIIPDLSGDRRTWRSDEDETGLRDESGPRRPHVHPGTADGQRTAAGQAQIGT